MGWEDRLRQLDGEVASGQVSAQEYRRQRDELLAEAGQGARGNDPFPPPFRWSDQGADATQVVHPADPPPATAPVADPAPSADATQVVRPGRTPTAPGTGPADATQVVSSAPTDTDRTQVVRPGAPTRPTGPPPRPTTPPWLTPGPVGAPAPGELGSERPGLLRRVPPRRGRTVVGLALAVVLLVAVVVGSVLLLTRDDGPSTASGDPTRPSSSAAETTSARPVVPRPDRTADVLVDPRGETRGGGGRFDLAALAASKAVPAAALTSLRTAGMVDAVLKTTTDSGVTVGAFAFTAADAARATTLLVDLAAQQTAGGLKRDGARSTDDVTVVSSAGSGGAPFVRALYVTYDRVVQLDSFGPDLGQAQKAMDTLLAAQVALSPPTAG